MFNTFIQQNLTYTTKHSIVTCSTLFEGSVYFAARMAAAK